MSLRVTIGEVMADVWKGCCRQSAIEWYTRSGFDMNVSDLTISNERGSIRGGNRRFEIWG